MLRAVIVAGSVVLSGAATGGTSAILAEAAATPFDWSSLAGGALGSSPAAIVLGWRLTKQDKDSAAKEAEIKRLNDLIVDRVVPLVERATSTLREVQSGMDATISRSRPEDVGRAIGELREAIEDMRRGRGNG